MHFNKKMWGLSIVTIMILSSCGTEDKYRAKECLSCLPSLQDKIEKPDPQNPSQKQVTINFSKNDGNVTWSKNHEDEATQGMVKGGQNTIVYNKWHNRLIVIDPNSKTIKSDSSFLDIVGERDVVDGISGASEQVLEKVLVSDASLVFAMVIKHEDEKLDKGVGIYSGDITNTIPEIRFASKVNGAVDFYNYPVIKDMALSADGLTLIAGGDDRKIKIFNVSDLTTPTEINVGKKIRSLDFSVEDKYIFCGSGGLTNLLRIYDFATKAQIAEVSVSDAPLSVLEVPNANKIIVLFAGSNKVRIYDITDITNPTLSKTLIINGKAKSISISSDNKLFAIAATGKQVNLFTIDGQDSPKVITSSELVTGVSFLSESKLIVSGESSIEYYDINVSE